MGPELGPADESVGPGVQWVRDFEQSPGFFSRCCMELPNPSWNLVVEPGGLVGLMMAV